MILVQRVPVFAFMAYSGLGCWGAFSAGKPKPPSSWPLEPASLWECWDVTKLDENSYLSSKFLPGDLLLTGYVQDTSPGRRTGRILTRCPNHQLVPLSGRNSFHLLVFTISFFWSLPTAYDHKWALECRLIGRLRALSSGSALYLPKQAGVVSALLEKLPLST